MRKPFSLLLWILLLLTSCQKVFLGPVKSNTPVENFETLWHGCDRWYGLFETRGVNWDSLYTVYRPQINNRMSNAQLYAVLSQLITPLDDIHVFLQPTTDGLPRYESSVFFRRNKVQQDFSLRVIRQHYLPSMTTVDDKLHYGILDGNIGYLHFADFGLPLRYYQQQMPAIISALKNTKGLVIDIRNHGGGDDAVSRYIGGLFAKEKALFMTTRKRNGPKHTDFTAADRWYVEAGNQYTKPLVLLTTRWTASAGETFTWALNTQTHVTQVGDTTAGGFTDLISRELPNGWLYFLGVGDYRNAKGESEEGKGVAPRLRIVNTKADIDAGRDKVLEKAIALLR